VTVQPGVKKRWGKKEAQGSENRPKGKKVESVSTKKKGGNRNVHISEETQTREEKGN